MLPSARQIDRRLIGGGLMLGIGGVPGFCPGPALVALCMGKGEATVLVAAMQLGMGAFELLVRRKQAGRRALV